MRQGAPRTVSFELLDDFNARRGISAMMRVRGYSLAITAVMQTEGAVPPGAKPAYEVMPFARYADELGKRGIRIEERETSALPWGRLHCQ